MSKLTGRALLTALLISTGGTALADLSGGSDGGATLNLKARIVESTCAFSFSGADGATLDFGEWSYVNAGTPAAPKYMLMPVRGKGEIATNTVFNVSVTADPNCPTEGKMVVMVDGFDTSPGTAGFAGARLLKGKPSAVLTAPRMNADGSEAATPYYFPYDVTFILKQNSGSCTAVSNVPFITVGGTSGYIARNDNNGAISCSTLTDGWGNYQTKSAYTSSEQRIFITSGARDNYYDRLHVKGSLPTKEIWGLDQSSSAQLDITFAGPTEITTLWGANPPPPGTIFTGQLTLTATYL